jgi:hypothetical protein
MNSRLTRGSLTILPSVLKKLLPATSSKTKRTFCLAVSIVNGGIGGCVSIARSQSKKMNPDKFEPGRR